MIERIYRFIEKIRTDKILANCTMLPCDPDDLSEFELDYYEKVDEISKKRKKKKKWWSKHD